jgi:hypothetical protein
MKSGSKFRIRETRDDKSLLFKIAVIVKAKSIIVNKIIRILLLCGNLKGGTLGVRG